jgi:GNAT superfamily N-acetyltransferase
VQRRVDDGALLICRAIDHLQFNRLGYLGTAAPVRAEAVDAALADFDAAGVKNWIVHVAQGADSLNTVCAARGLTPHPRTWAKFIRDNRAAPVPATALAIREVDAGDGRAFGAAAAQGFGMPPAMGDWLAALAGRPRWRCFVGFDGDTPAAAGAVFIDGACAWLGVGATIGSHRKRGAQSALLAARINAAIAAGCRFSPRRPAFRMPAKRRRPTPISSARVLPSRIRGPICGARSVGRNLLRPIGMAGRESKFFIPRPAYRNRQTQRESP